MERGLPFIFKGGTSLLLHLPEVRRLSRDIDIVCGRPAAGVTAAVAAVGGRAPFLRWEEDDRGARGLPQRRHFKFFYRSALPGLAGQELLLDVVEEAREVHTLVMRPIRTSFLAPEAEHLVRVPTIESLDPFQLKQEVERRLKKILARAEIVPRPSGGSAPQPGADAPACSAPPPEGHSPRRGD